MLRSWRVLFIISWFTNSSFGDSACPHECFCLGSAVDCSKQGLRHVPEDLPDWVEVLVLKANLLSNLSNAFSKLHKLRELDLSRNSLEEVFPSDAFDSLTSLEYLTLDNNRLQSLPDFSRLSNLTSLSVKNNRLEEVPVALFTLPNLRSLDLSRNNILNFPNLSFESPNLQLSELCLENNRLASLESGAFKLLPSLTTLKLGRNRLKSLQKGIFVSSKNLRTLDLSRNKLRNIDGLTFVDATQLEVLILARNGIRSLSDGAFLGLDYLTELQLQHNQISVITKGWLYGLTALEKLDLHNNELTDIHNGSWEFCTSLRDLDISSNRLPTLVSKMFQGLNTLKHLNASYSRLASIGYDAESPFVQLKQLEVLDLTGNQIAVAVEDYFQPFASLIKLKLLYVSFNGIQRIPRDVFSGLGELQFLALEGNRISVIEENAFAPLVNLEELWFNSTSLMCDCNLTWFATWLRDSGLGDQIENAVCFLPDSLTGTNVIDVPEDNFTCVELALPRLISHPESQAVLKGDNVTLSCVVSVNSQSSAALSWKRDNDLVLEQSGSISIHTQTSQRPNDSFREVSSTITLFKLQPADSGMFQCIANSDRGSSYSQRAKLTVYVFPKFLKTPADLMLTVGGTARLECSASGLPLPQVQWHKDGGVDFPAARERRMHVMPTDDVFFIVNVKASDSGIYTCLATNVAGSIKVDASITVLEQPSFQKPMKHKTYPVGQTAVMECLVSGSPKPAISWFINNKTIVTNSRLFLTAENQILVIVKTRSSDTGVYTCEIYNHLGVQRQSAKLTVMGNSGDVNEPFAKVNGENESEEIVDTEDRRLDRDSGSSLFDPLTTTGIIVIAVLSCVVVLTAIVWVCVIAYVRKNIAAAKLRAQRRATLPSPLVGDESRKSTSRARLRDNKQMISTFRTKDCVSLYLLDEGGPSDDLFYDDVAAARVANDSCAYAAKLPRKCSQCGTVADNCSSASSSATTGDSGQFTHPSVDEPPQNCGTCAVAGTSDLTVVLRSACKTLPGDQKQHVATSDDR